MNSEIQLYEQIAQYMNLQYPTVPFHFDLSGLWTPSHQARNLYGRLNKRAWPDLFIACDNQTNHDNPESVKRIYYGLFLELKKEGTQLYKKDGMLRANSHHAEQYEVLAQLRSEGYKAEFAVGFDEATKIIDEYLSHVEHNSPALSSDPSVF